MLDDIDQLASRQRVEAFLACRDAGRLVASDRLHAGVSLIAVVKAAHELSAYADEAQAIVAEEYRPRLDCREGCWYCCSKPGVLVSVAELLSVLEFVANTFTKSDMEALRARAGRYVQLTATSDREAHPTAPCPLLADGRCSVYAVRPLTCRGYNSMNVGACQRAYEDDGGSIPIFTLLRDVTDGVAVGAGEAFKSAGFPAALVDLGTALDIALTSGETFSEDVVNGGGRLSAAENTSLLDELLSCVCERARSIGLDPS